MSPRVGVESARPPAAETKSSAAIVHWNVCLRVIRALLSIFCQPLEVSLNQFSILLHDAFATTALAQAHHRLHLVVSDLHLLVTALGISPRQPRRAALHQILDLALPNFVRDLPRVPRDLRIF